MADTCSNHTHVHGSNCGHVAVQHEGHVDYLHDGHLHHQTAAGQVEEHVIGVTDGNPAACTSGHACTAHPADHVHGADCGHPAVPHGDHVDYLVDGHLHHQHAGHCDNHGPVALVK
ncbi:MAG: hypothetical protein C0478_10685 [Planctomyces sp.]|nr:hypothetical protein [Planctomyces sp.]